MRAIMLQQCPTWKGSHQQQRHVRDGACAVSSSVDRVPRDLAVQD